MAWRVDVIRNGCSTAGDRETSTEEKVEAKRVARRAIALGGDDAVALSTAGHALSYVAGDEEGVTAIERAIALNPNLA